jgi:hypothetical protein
MRWRVGTLDTIREVNATFARAVLKKALPHRAFTGEPKTAVMITTRANIP